MNKKNFLLILLIVFSYTLPAQVVQNDTLQVEKDSLDYVVNETDTITDKNIDDKDNSEPAAADKNHEEIMDLQLMIPTTSNWNVVNEGATLEADFYALGGKDQNYHYDIIEGKDTEMTLDSTGSFKWTPGYDFVDRLEKSKKVPVVFEVSNNDGQVSRKSVDFIVMHVNQPPKVGDLKNFYVKYNEENTYKIDLNVVQDPDNDPVIFKQIPQIMPEGANLSENGVFTWKPSYSQFNRLKTEPVKLSFIVEDQPYKSQVEGYFNILVTQMDLPPEITMIPKNDIISTKENETVNFKFFLSDPNGDADISDFNLVSEDLRITKDFLVQNSKTQWEFIWTPGYDFVREVEDSLTVEVNFYAVDKTYLRDEQKTTITIINTPNQEKIDQGLYAQYRTTLVRVWDLLEQLNEKEDEYYKKLRKARKTKTGIAITDASLGAVTALSPQLIENEKDSKLVTGIGGTTVMTMGTLEAADVIAKSPSEMISKLNRIIEKKNELLMHGNVYARRYSTTLNRREKGFTKDSEDLLSRLIIKEMATLEISAGWENPKQAKDKNLRHTFPDFVPNEDL